MKYNGASLEDRIQEAAEAVGNQIRKHNRIRQAMRLVKVPKLPEPEPDEEDENEENEDPEKP